MCDRILVLQSNPSVLIVSKASGIPSVGGLNEALGQIYPELNSLPEHGLVHRLDTGTSGCLAFARNLETYQFLRNAFHNGHPRLHKEYEAIVVIPKNLNFYSQCLPITIDYPIARLQKSAKRMKVLLKPTHTVGIRGQPLPARTTVLSIEKIITEPHYEICRLNVRIQTGVMHQIRAHLSAVGAGILGDPIYKLAPDIRELGELIPEKFQRFFLHAAKLSLPLPDGNTLTAEAPWNPVPEIQSLAKDAGSSNLGTRND